MAKGVLFSFVEESLSRLPPLARWEERGASRAPFLVSFAKAIRVAWSPRVRLSTLEQPRDVRDVCLLFEGHFSIQRTVLG